MERDRSSPPMTLPHRPHLLRLLAWGIPSSTPTSAAALVGANGRTEGREPEKHDFVLVMLHELGDAVVEVVARYVEVGFAGARPAQGAVDPLPSSPQALDRAQLFGYGVGVQMLISCLIHRGICGLLRWCCLGCRVLVLPLRLFCHRTAIAASSSSSAAKLATANTSDSTVPADGVLSVVPQSFCSDSFSLIQ